MTSGLRKMHTYIWLILVIGIPILLFLATKDLALFSSRKTTNPTLLKTSIKAPLKVAENDLLKASTQVNSIEVILKSTIKNSSSILYTIDSKGNKKQLIGQITNSGIYNFKIDQEPLGIILHDAIKNEVITKLTF